MIKKLSSILLASTFLAIQILSSNLFGQATENHLLRAVPVPGKVILDGELGDWDRSGAIVLADDLKAPRYLLRVSAMYDEQGMYFSFEFKDPTPMINYVDPLKSPGNGWKGDAVQLRINCAPEDIEDIISFDFDTLIHHVDCYWYTEGKQVSAHIVRGNMAPGCSPTTKITPAIGKGVEAAFKSDSDGQGYVQEMLISWALLRHNATPLKGGQSFRMAIEAMWGNSQKDAPQSDRITDLLNPKRPERGNIWQNPSAWGTVSLLKDGKVEPDNTAKQWAELLNRYKPGQPSIAEKTTSTPPPDRPCLYENDKVSRLLNKWYEEKTAAGNHGDFYDNRDREHSTINMKEYPQLRKTEYTAEQKSKNIDWALCLGFWPFPTVGNSSTSAPPEQGGSNPRQAKSSPAAIQALRSQYFQNNVYIYPEHMDYDPGRNGRPGYGDLYPLNSPYLLISQGSSGSDQPFIKAIIRTMAAFHPQVKKKLVELKLLAPTIQRIFRSSNYQVAVPEDYFSGRAHPVVFQGNQIDELRMVTMAHEMKLNTIPPLAQIRLIEEEPLTPNINAPANTPPTWEHLCTFPELIGRVHRRWSRDIRMKVNASGSFDWQNKPLTYRWVLLQGDPSLVTIKTSDNASQAEITVSWHDRFPVPSDDKILSNRVDIALFVSNGLSWSAPAFICIFYPDNELRTYDEHNRLVDLFLAGGDTTIGYESNILVPAEGVIPYDIRNWSAIIKALTTEDESSISHLFSASFNDEQRQALIKTEQEVHGALSQYFTKLKQAQEKAGITAPTQTKPDRNTAELISKILLKPIPTLGASAKKSIEKILNDKKDDPKWYLANQKIFDEIAKKRGESAEKKLQDARKRLIDLGIYQPIPDKQLSWQLNSVRSGTQPVHQRLTKYELMEIQRFQLTLITKILFPDIVSREYKSNYVDERIAKPQSIWTVFTYDNKSDMTPTITERECVK